MCTYAFHFNPSVPWAFRLAGNRDELMDRPWLAPGEHWTDRPGVIAGKDIQAGGSWAGMNDAGVVAVILNRWNSLGAKAGKRSRGELVLDALDYPDAAQAVRALEYLDPNAYRDFNLIIADNCDCFWLHLTEEKGLALQSVTPGLHLISHGDLDDINARRIQRYLPQFEQLGPPDDPNDAASWQHWRQLLNDASYSPNDDVNSSLFVNIPSMNFGTGSQSFMALYNVDFAQSKSCIGAYWFADAGQKLMPIL